MFKKNETNRRRIVSSPAIIVPTVHYNQEGTTNQATSSQAKFELEAIVKGNVVDMMKEISDVIEHCNSREFTEDTFRVESVLLRAYLELINIYPSLREEYKWSRASSTKTCW
jgi:hypothetical protein